jgi:hypothetical protein
MALQVQGLHLNQVCCGLPYIYILRAVIPCVTFLMIYMIGPLFGSGPGLFAEVFDLGLGDPLPAYFFCFARHTFGSGFRVCWTVGMSWEMVSCRCVLCWI